MADVVPFRVHTCACGRLTRAASGVCGRCVGRERDRPGKRDPELLEALARGTNEQHFREWA